MRQSLRERIPEFAVLKTLGFSDAKVAVLVLGESTRLCTLGGILGTGLTLAAAPPLNNQLAQFGMGPFIFSPGTVVAAIGIAVVLGVVVGIQPAVQVNRLAIADALRRT